MEVKEFDSVRLKDGRRGAVVEVLGDQEAFLVDTGSSPEDWKTEYVERDEIAEVIS